MPKLFAPISQNQGPDPKKIGINKTLGIVTQKIDSIWTDSTFTEKIQGGREQEEENERKMGLIFREFFGPKVFG